MVNGTCPNTTNEQLPLLNCRRQIPSEPEANLPAAEQTSKKDIPVAFQGKKLSLRRSILAKSIKSSCDDTKHDMHLPRRHMLFLYSAAFQPEHVLCKSQYAKNCLAIFTLECQRSRQKRKHSQKQGHQIGYLKVSPFEL